MAYLERSIYLDHAALAPMSSACLERMMPFFTASFGLFSQPHRRGQELYLPLKESYEALQSLLNCSAEATILFTSSGSEAVNHVINSVYHDVARVRGKNHFITASSEEAPLLLATERLESYGCRTSVAAVNEQLQLTPEMIADLLTPRTALVSLSWGNGLSGTLQPVMEIAQLLSERGVLFHLDASHVVGRYHLRLEEVGADFITLNGAQLHAPQSSGVLYIRPGLTLSPFLLGGNQQGGMRGCELDTPSIVGLGVAARELIASLDFVTLEIARLRQLFEQMICEGIKGARPLLTKQRRLPHITMIHFPGLHGELLLFALNQRGIYASLGGGNVQKIEHLLTPILSPHLAQSTLSFSFSRMTVEAEVIEAAGEIIALYQQLHRFSCRIDDE